MVVGLALSPGLLLLYGLHQIYAIRKIVYPMFRNPVPIATFFKTYERVGKIMTPSLYGEEY